MKIDIEILKKDVKDGNKKLEAIHTDLTEFIKDAEKKFAGKWTEKVLVFIGSAVGLAIVGAIMTLILE